MDFMSKAITSSTRAVASAISNMFANNQQNWLEGIKVAQAAYKDSATTHEIASMRTLMENLDYFLLVTS